METKTVMTCKIIAHTSNKNAAMYRVQALGRVYEVCVEDHPGQDCTVLIDGLDEKSELFQAIQGAVLKDWLGIDAAR
jgi:HPt (histidine-containing phosphotransfer) domain-containing protein